MGRLVRPYPRWFTAQTRYPIAASTGIWCRHETACSGKPCRQSANLSPLPASSTSKRNPLASMNVVCMAGTYQSAHQVVVKSAPAGPVALWCCLRKPSFRETPCKPNAITDLLRTICPSLQLNSCPELHDPWRRNKEVIGCADRIAGEKGKDLFLPAWQLGL